MIGKFPRWLRKIICGQGKASVQRIQYALPSSNVFRKRYNKDVFFDEVDWSDWTAVVNGFQSRFVDWYFKPLSEFPTTGHEAYPVLCAMCALVDTFAHYDGDRGWHEQKHYKEFLRKLDPVFRTKFSSPIATTRYRDGAWVQGSLRDFADVFYTGVRCSLHHHGDLAPFAGMSRTGVLAQQRTGAGASTCGQIYSIVVFDPWRFRDTLEAWFQGYCADLRKNPQADRAKRFRSRFEADFAISIPEP